MRMALVRTGSASRPFPRALLREYVAGEVGAVLAFLDLEEEAASLAGRREEDVFPADEEKSLALRDLQRSAKVTFSNA